MLRTTTTHKDTPGMDAMAWYVLHSHPRQETILFRHLQSMQLEAFFPVLRVKPVNPRARKLIPYFPGYLFLHVGPDLIRQSQIQWMPYLSEVVSVGGEPASVPDGFIHSLQAYLAEINQKPISPAGQFRAGDEVIITTGIFTGYHALFDLKLNGRDRVRVLLQFLGDGRSLPVELSAGDLHPIKKPH